MERKAILKRTEPGVGLCPRCSRFRNNLFYSEKENEAPFCEDCKTLAVNLFRKDGIKVTIKNAPKPKPLDIKPEAEQNEPKPKRVQIRDRRKPNKPKSLAESLLELLKDQCLDCCEIYEILKDKKPNPPKNVRCVSHTLAELAGRKILVKQKQGATTRVKYTLPQNKHLFNEKFGRYFIGDVVTILGDRRITAKQLAEELNRPAPTLSKWLEILRDRGEVTLENISLPGQKGWSRYVSKSLAAITSENRINTAVDYLRILPRDFFNESKLLCCLGRVSVHVHDNKTGKVKITEVFDGKPFSVKQNQDTGNLYVENYRLFIQKEELFVYLPYNCTDTKYPLKGIWRNKEYQILSTNGLFLFKQVGE